MFELYMFITSKISLLPTFDHPGGALHALHPPGLGIWQGAGLAEVGWPQHSAGGLEEGVAGVGGSTGEAGEEGMLVHG